MEALAPEPLSTLAQAVLLLGGLAFVALVVSLALRHTRRVNEADRELVAHLHELFTQVASPCGLNVVTPGPAPSSTTGYVFAPPMLLGERDGFSVQLDIRGTHDHDGDVAMQLALRAPESAAAWPELELVSGRVPPPEGGLPPHVRAALEALSASSARVRVTGHALIAAPRVTPTRDVDGRQRFLELDPERLARFIGLGLDAARALRAAG